VYQQEGWPVATDDRVHAQFANVYVSVGEGFGEAGRKVRRL
jgi:hypothetical protein